MPETITNPVVLISYRSSDEENVGHLQYYLNTIEYKDFKDYGPVVANLIYHVAKLFAVSEDTVWEWVAQCKLRYLDGKIYSTREAFEQAVKADGGEVQYGSRRVECPPL